VRNEKEITFGSCEKTDEGVADSTSDAWEALKIVTTFLPLYAHTASLIDENDVLTNLVPPGTSIHFRQPKPSDVVAMEEADVIITNGIGLEEFLDNYLEGLQSKWVRVIDTSEGVEMIEDEEEGHKDNDDHDEEEGHKDNDDHNDEEGHNDHDDHDEEGHNDHNDHDEEEDHDDHEGHHHDGPDPHIWLDPNNAKIQVATITQALIELDPTQQLVYEKASSIYTERLNELDLRIKTQLADKDIKPFIVFHDAYQYFLRAYDLDASQVGLVQEFHGDNPSQKDIANLIKVIKDEWVNTIYTEPQFNPSVVKSLEEETGVISKEIDPIGSEMDEWEYIRIIESLAEAFIDA